MSHRIYASNADRQRAFRARRLGSAAAAPPLPPPCRKAPANPSRPARINSLLSETLRLSTEYQSWLDRLPPNLAGSRIAAQLEEVVAQLDEACAILEAIDPPTVGTRP
jgi:hypothetical protein